MTDLNEIQEQIRQLRLSAEQYGFNNILQFSAWVEDNNLGEILFGKDQEDIESEKEEINTDSMLYKSTTLALDILSLPEIKKINLDNITFDQWLELSRKAKIKKKGSSYSEKNKLDNK